jgi:hypothetical protein
MGTLYLDPENSLESELEIGKWHTFPSLSSHQTSPPALHLPLQPLRIVVELDYPGEISFEVPEDYDSNSFTIPIDFNITFPSADPIFNPLAQKPHSRYHRFEVDYLPRMELPRLREAVKDLSQEVKEFYFQENGSLELPNFPVENSFFNGFWLNFILSDIYRFVSDHNISKEFNDLEDFVNGISNGCSFLDLNNLINQYNEEGQFYGDCKAVSTFTAGMLQGIGLPARNLQGNVCYSPPLKEQIREREEAIVESENKVQTFQGLLP